MNNQSTGKIIKALRIANGMTQKQLAEKLNLTDKTVSKWEREAGLPDISVLNDLSVILGVDISALLSGSLSENDFTGGNMKNTKYYVCPNCGNISICSGNAEVSCCGRRLEELVPEKADAEQKLSVEVIEDDWFISSSHPMTKDSYISFVVFVTGEKLQVYKQYPEWEMSLRIPMRGHGKLIWYSTDGKLFYQLI